MASGAAVAAGQRGPGEAAARTEAAAGCSCGGGEGRGLQSSCGGGGGGGSPHTCVGEWGMADVRLLGRAGNEGVGLDRVVPPRSVQRRPLGIGPVGEVGRSQPVAAALAVVRGDVPGGPVVLHRPGVVLARRRVLFAVLCSPRAECSRPGRVGLPAREKLHELPGRVGGRVGGGVGGGRCRAERGVCVVAGHPHWGVEQLGVDRAGGDRVVVEDVLVEVRAAEHDLPTRSRSWPLLLRLLFAPASPLFLLLADPHHQARRKQLCVWNAHYGR